MRGSARPDKCVAILEVVEEALGAMNCAPTGFAAGVGARFIAPAKERQRACPGFSAVSLVALVAVMLASPLLAERVTREQDGFTLEFEPRRRVAVESIFEALATAQSSMEAQLEIDNPEPVRIILCESGADFDEMLGYDAPWYIAGIARADVRLIVIDLAIASDSIEAVLAHELSHVYLADALRSRVSAVPRWMNEAIAKRTSGEWNPSDDIVLRDAVLGGHLLSFAEIEDSFPAEHRTSNIAYAQSATFLDFAEENYGPGVLLRYLAAIRDGQAHEAAIEQACGVPLDALEAQWRDYLAEHYRRLVPFYQLEELIFLVMALALIAAAIRAVRRRRRWNAEQDLIEKYGSRMSDVRQVQGYQGSPKKRRLHQ